MASDQPLPLVTTIPDYCRVINIPPPRHNLFDIRRFEDNMHTVNARQPPFRHAFYALALRHSGSNTEVNGQPLRSSLFFNAPYQVITWDIKPDWQGWYILFGREFVSMNPVWNHFLDDYPFFRIDRQMAFDLPTQARQEADQWFGKIFEEYHGERHDKWHFVYTYTQLLLHLTRRYVAQLTLQTPLLPTHTADMLLISRLQTLIQDSLWQENIGPEVRSPAFYAHQLAVHPNHLNAVLRRSLDKTTSQLIHEQLTLFAKSLLRQTGWSLKEIAFRLQFAEPTHFNAFFKKQTGLTPGQFRQQEYMQAPGRNG